MVGFEAHFFFMEIENNLKKIVSDYFEHSDYKIIDLVLRGERGTKVFEVYADNKEGVNIDDLARINKELNEIVDKEIFAKDISKLVVSSPGAERPVKFIWQLYKHSGRVLEVELENGEHIEGKLISLSEENKGITLDIMKKEKGMKVRTEQREINFKDIKELKVKISFSKK